MWFRYMQKQVVLPDVENVETVVETLVDNVVVVTIEITG